jgi:hypothetical protein
MPAREFCSEKMQVNAKDAEGRRGARLLGEGCVHARVS